MCEVHTPLTQLGVLFPHLFPHAPQLLLSDASCASQPLAAALSKLGLHPAIPHTPTLHDGTVLVGMGHTVPQTPQFATSVLMLISHPFGYFMSQSAKPWLQLATEHWPAMHAGTPPATPQARLH